MRRSALLVSLCATLSLTLGAQEARQQGTALTLPAYTDSQLRDGLTGNLNAVVVVGVAQAKSLGRTAADFGRFGGSLVARRWGPPNSGTAIRYVRGLAFNFAGYSGAEVRVTATSDTSATVRMHRRYYLSFFGPSRQALGVTVDEYEQMTRALVSTIGQYLGLRSTMRFDGDWATVTVTGRGSAAPWVDFPNGTYTAAFSDSAAKTHPELAGAWEITYMPNGHLVLRHDGSPFIESDYEVSVDQIAFPHPEMGSPGITPCSTPAAYRWMIDARTKNIRFERLADDCAPRVAFLTNVSLTKK